MPAGGTAVSGDLHPMRDRLPFLQFDQVSVIMGELLLAALSPAKRAGRTAVGTESVQILLQPLFIRKRYLIRLAKNCKQSYHKVWWLARLSGAALERGEKITLVGAASPFFCYTAILLEKEQRKKRAVFGCTLS